MDLREAVCYGNEFLSYLQRIYQRCKEESVKPDYSMYVSSDLQTQLLKQTNSLKVMISFCQSVLECKGMPEKKKEYVPTDEQVGNGAYYDLREIKGWNDCHDEWIAHLMKILDVKEIEDFLLYFKWDSQDIEGIKRPYELPTFLWKEARGKLATAIVASILGKE